MDKQQDILATDKQEKSKLDFEGVMFYLLLISAVFILPVTSAFLILRAANS